MRATYEIPEPPRLEGEPYPYFLLHLDEISAWLRAGFTKKAIWETCKAHPSGFAGSYRTFLRYCRKHALEDPRGHVAPNTGSREEPPRSLTPRGSNEASTIGPARKTRYPAPLERPPMLKLTEEEWKQ